MKTRSRVWVGLIAAGLMMIGLTSQAQADPAVSVSLSGSATMRWDGVAANARLGQNTIANAGDINGDGRDDVLASQANPVANRGAYVFFTPKTGAGATDAGSNLKPQQGYLMNGTGFGPPQLASIGDQNGDGIPDVLYGYAGSETVYVVYGVSDPSTLPTCDVSPVVTRCLNVTTMTPGQGYKIESGTPGEGLASQVGNVGDVNGDGIDDIGMGAPGAAYVGAQSGSIYVLFGGRTAPGDSSPVVLNTLPASEAVRIDGPTENAGLAGALGIGDMTGDGRDDAALIMIGLGADPATTFVFSGAELDSSPIGLATFGPTEGYKLQSSPLTVSVPSNVGDVNGDGRPDLAVGMDGILSANGAASILYGPASPFPATAINGLAPTASEGYGFAANDTGGHLGKATAGIGDLNGDGIPDQLIGANTESGGGNAGAGAANIVFGKRPTPLAPVPLGSLMSPDDAVALIGSTVNAQAGTSFQSAGDLDSDGLTDFFIAAPQAKESTFNNAGSIYLVPGSAIIGQATTGLAGEVSANGASLGGTATANGRESEAYFEWGTDETYGNTSSVEAVGSSKGAKFFEADITGLEAETTYHYRSVSENDLGIKAFGSDRTFTTSKVPQTPCQIDPNADGCRPQCVAHPEEAGCKTIGPRLSTLVASPKTIKVKRGKKTAITAVVTNTGDKAAEGTKICLKAPGSLVKGAKCQTVGSLAAGSTATRNFTVTVKKKAKKGKKATLKFTASATGTAAKTASSKVVVG